MAHPAAIAELRMGALADLARACDALAAGLGIPQPEFAPAKDPALREARHLRALADFMAALEESLSAPAGVPEPPAGDSGAAETGAAPDAGEGANAPQRQRERRRDRR